MRAVLVVNPNATTTTVRGRDLLVRALRSEVDLEVAYTRERGHAVEIARDAANRGYDLIVTLGGDGTVNEVANGLLTADDGPAGDRAHERPALATVPGGSTNVFARAVGMPRDWAEGTGVILEALRSGRSRTVGLGRADERYFTFCAGLGADAAVIGRVEKARARGATSTVGLYLRSAVTQFAKTEARRAPVISLERLDAPVETGLATVIIQNTDPWTYIGDRPVRGCPEASFETGLDLLALRQLRGPSTVVAATRMLSRQPNPRGKQVLHLHDVERFTLRSTVPIAFQVDGDYLGERQKLDFAAIPNALRVVC